ncbi:MAG: hypothetical protein SGILL_006457 [Bacillariaceae sp.]
MTSSGGINSNNNDTACSCKEQHQTSLFSFFSKAPKIRKLAPATENNAKCRVYRSTDGSVAADPSLPPNASTSVSSCANEATTKSLQDNKSATTKLTQVYIDCGQKQFGQIECAKCGMLYMPGVPEDERHHRQFCNAYSKGVACVNSNVRGGNVVQRSNTRSGKNAKQLGRYVIVQWKPTSMKSKKNQPSQWPLLAQMIANDLGMDEATCLGHLSTQAVFLYLGSVSRDKQTNNSNTPDKGKTNHILGAATIQSVTKAYRMSSLHDRARTQSKAMLGVGLLWTHPAARKTRIASTLLDTALQNSVFGMHVSKSMLAFSSPTKAGYDFAMRYLADHQSGTKCSEDGKKTERAAPLVFEM